MGALTQIIDRGLAIEADGGQLVVTPAHKLNDELRRAVRDNKPQLLRLLHHGVTLAELRKLAGPDWAMCEADPALLEAFASAVNIRQMRERGAIPPFYSATTTCRHCGPVPTWPECPPTVEGCPWCFNRLEGKPIPRCNR